MADEVLLKIVVLSLNNLRPDKYTQRSQWNASWERDLSEAYRPIPTQPGRRPKVVLSPEMQENLRSASEQSLLAQQQMLQCIIEIQTDIVEYVSVKRQHEDVASAWKALDDATRRMFVLEAFYRVSLAGPDLEGFRKWCPDMTIDNICGNSGQLFLQHITALIEYWDTNPTQPILFPHDAVDRVNEESNLFRFTVRGNKIARAYYVTFVMWRILLKLYDDDESYLISEAPKQTGSNRALKALVRERAKQADGQEFKAALQATAELFQEMSVDHVKVCWMCGKDPARSKSGGPLKLCMACNRIGRKIWYCSTECQKDDWKNGKPTPHKAFCGKSLATSLFGDVDRVM